MLPQACLDFMANGVHDHVLCATDELIVLGNKLFKDRSIRCLVFCRAFRVGQRRGGLGASAKCSLVIDFCPEFQEELASR